MYLYAALYFSCRFLISAPWDITEINHLNSSPLLLFLLGKHDLIKGTLPLQSQQFNLKHAMYTCFNSEGDFGFAFCDILL